MTLAASHCFIKTYGMEWALQMGGAQKKRRGNTQTRELNIVLKVSMTMLSHREFIFICLLPCGNVKISFAQWTCVSVSI